MAMRLLSQAEFESELRNAGFEPLEEYSATGHTRIWWMPGGEPVTVSIRKTYPDWVLDRYLGRAGVLYRDPLGT